MNKQDKPRICEVLGVEVGERFTSNRKASSAHYLVSHTGHVFHCASGDTISGADLAYIINHPECIVRKKRFTEQEIEDANAIKRLILGATKISRKHGTLNVIVICEYGPVLNKDLFPSIAPGESYTLDEIIGDG